MFFLTELAASSLILSCTALSSPISQPPRPLFHAPRVPYSSSPIDTARRALAPWGGPWLPRALTPQEERGLNEPLVSWEECSCRRPTPASPHDLLCPTTAHHIWPQPTDKMDEDVVQRGHARPLDLWRRGCPVWERGIPLGWQHLRACTVHRRESFARHSNLAYRQLKR